MTTLNEHSLPHNLYNDLIHFSESDKDLKETGNNDFLSDIDPDIGLHTIQNNQCSYYNITEFKTDITIKNHISILAVNIRSLNKNFKQFINYISSLEMKWSFIQLTETWGKPHSIIHHTLAGYEHVYDIRHDKPGGGCSLFINENIPYTLRKDLTLAESVFIEVEKCTFKKKKQHYIGGNLS